VEKSEWQFFPKRNEFKLKQQKNSSSVAIVYPSGIVGLQYSEFNSVPYDKDSIWET